ncbi:MAG: hypothetical protein ACLQG5_09290 [Methanobacterium sp.]
MGVFEENLNQYFKDKYRDIEKRISSIKTEKFHELDKKQYINELVEEFSIDIPIVNFSKIDPEMARIHIEPTLKHFMGSYEDRIKYKIPFDGDSQLLKYMVLGMDKTKLEKEYIYFEITKENNRENVNIIQKQTKKTLESKYELLTNKIKEYNETLQNKIEEKYDKRNKKISDDDGFLDSLDDL